MIVVLQIYLELQNFKHVNKKVIYHHVERDIDITDNKIRFTPGSMNTANFPLTHGSVIIVSLSVKYLSH